MKLTSVACNLVVILMNTFLLVITSFHASYKLLSTFSQFCCPCRPPNFKLSLYHTYFIGLQQNREFNTKFSVSQTGHPSFLRCLLPLTPRRSTCSSSLIAFDHPYVFSGLKIAKISFYLCSFLME
jgi:hypothetical protein